MSAAAEPLQPLQLTLDELAGTAGTELGTSAWHRVSQDRISTFAEATDDHQWIHVDPERAAKGPFGSTIAHGYLTLSLFPTLLLEVIEVVDASVIINYGLNRVRFPATVPVNALVRLVLRCTSVDAISGGYQVQLEAVFEREGSPKPACVAEIIFRYYA
ncbi:MAG: MaoC family dehydratase [Egibacteraceae bacterium]